MNRKKMILLTSLLAFIPMIAGILLWNQLPEELPIHFNTAGEIDNRASKTIVVFLFPLFLWVIHLLEGFVILADPKKQNISDKLFLLVLMIVPLTSVFVSILTYGTAFGIDISVNAFGYLFVGIIFILVGNYLPKSRQNYTIGIKLPWTLNDTENWNKTHRFGGIVWLLCGVLILTNTMFDIVWIIPVVVVAAVLLPTLYSYLLFVSKTNKNHSDKENKI